MRPLLSTFSIRWRLALLSAGITFIVLCCFAVVIGQLTASRVRSDFNHQVAAAVDDLRDRLAVEFVGGVPKVSPRLTDYAGSQHAAIRVLAARSGGMIDQTPHAPNFGLPGIAVNRTDQVGGYRVETRVTVLSNSAFSIPVYVQYARRVSDVENTISRVRLFLLLGVLGGTTIALALALILSRRALAPISRLTQTARRIAETRDPNRSVPIPQSEDEVAELARTLDDMLHALEASRAESAAQIVRQRQFVADASHELRTPLTSVLANLELLTEVLEGEPADAAKSALRSTHRMRRLVGDLLLLARADAERETPRSPTDLATIVVDAAAELGPLAADHVMTVDAPNGAVVEGARDELHRLALNLMQNALQHTPPGTHVRAIVRHDDDEVVLTVEDDGPGVPPSLRERVFDRFVRGEGDRGGTVGLGLSIVRAVARTHGGDVTLESPPSGGARFIVRLPATPVREAATAAA